MCITFHCCVRAVNINFRSRINTLCIDYIHEHLYWHYHSYGKHPTHRVNPYENNYYILDRYWSHSYSGGVPQKNIFLFFEGPRCNLACRQALTKPMAPASSSYDRKKKDISV